MSAELIKALEDAVAGSPGLDRKIARLFGWHRVEPRFTRGKHGGWISPGDFCGTMSDGAPILDGLHGTDIHRDPPRFTASLDDAITLLPEGWQWQVSNRAPKPHAGRAYIHNRELHFIGIGAQTPNPAYRGYETTAATPALALCAAVLRATPTTLGED